MLFRSGIVAAFSTRKGGVSQGGFAALNLGLTTGDDRAAVAENRRRLCAAVGADPARTAQNHQVHGAEVRVAEPLPGGYLDPQGELPQADALITREPELALGAGEVGIAKICPHQIRILKAAAGAATVSLPVGLLCSISGPLRQ